MSNPIFKSVTVTKANLYGKICELLSEAGWENISSSEEDGDVFHSLGETANKDIFINISPNCGKTQSDFRTDDNQQYLFFRPIYHYEPNKTHGQKGTFSRNDSWLNLLVSESYAYHKFLLDQKMTLWYHVNANRMILYIEKYNIPNKVTGLGNNKFIFFGMPDELNRDKLNGNDECLLILDQTTVKVAGESLMQGAESKNRNLYYSNHPSNALNDNILINTAYYGNENLGIIAHIDGYYFIGNGNKNPISGYFDFYSGVSHKDIIEVDEKKYKCIFSLPSNANTMSNGGDVPMSHPNFSSHSSIALIRIE